MTVIFGASALTTGVCGAQSATQRIAFVKQMLETCAEFEGRDIAGGGLLGALGLEAKTMAFRYANFHVVNNELRYSQFRVTKRGNAANGNFSGRGSLFHYAVRLSDIDINRMQVTETKVDNDNLGIFFFNLTCTGAQCVSRHSTTINAPRQTQEGVNQRLESYIPAGTGATNVQDIAPIHVCDRPGTSGTSAAEAARIRGEMIAAINAIRFSGEMVNIALSAPVAAAAPQIVNPPPVFTGSPPAPAFSPAPAPVASSAAPLAFSGANMPPISSQTPFAPRGPIPLFPRN